jgi:hypothetical protein
LPDWALIHAVSDDPKLKEWQGKKEDCFCPLEETLWADDVKKKITKIYKAVGVPDTMKQKLVEPYAGCFGGINKEGACDFSKVNWQALLDYFEWESAAVTRNAVKSDKLQAQAQKKYGAIFSHYLVYQNYSEPRKGI